MRMNNLHFALYIFTLLSTTSSDEKSSIFEKSNLYNELNRQLRNAVCCVNKMKCCKNSTNTENVAIRAVLIRCSCSNTEESFQARKYKNPIAPSREKAIKGFQGFDDDELLSQSIVKNCRKKLILTIKVTSTGLPTLKNEYIVVDHVYDTISKKSIRLITPYVIKMKQEPIMQMYELRFLHVVNSLAKEEILNKHFPNYTGCDTTSHTPTCGRITYKGKVIPYSEGFCCSCDAIKNTRRQPESLNPYQESIVSYSDPAYLLDGVECPRNVRGHENVNQAGDLLNKHITRNDVKSKTIYVLNNSKGKVENHNSVRIHNNTRKTTTQSSKKKNKREDTNSLFEHYFDSLTDFIKDKDELNILEKSHLHKRQVLPSGVQRRGGQNCADRYTPKGLNPDTFHESTHCLRFSDLWYTVYHIQKPSLEHSILFQIFEKVEDISGNTVWRDLTNGKMVRVGTIQKQFVDDRKSMAITYDASPPKVEESSFSLNHKSALLLIPEGAKKCKVKEYPELQAGPSEYLVVHPSQITMDGDQCNVAGVGFEGFVKQPNRCSRPKDSCLSNQPHHLWKHDHEAEKLGKKGCFFLKHFGKLPKNPLRRDPLTGDQYLVLEYTGSFSSLIDIEIKADFNSVLRPQSTGRITEVYVDSTSASETILTVKLTNAGLTSSSFIVRLVDCPLEMPASFSNIESKPALIPPQHQHIFNLEIKCPLPADRFHCSIEALNSKRELVALRRIRLQKFDRCICTWHCLCACVGSSEGLKCIPMSLQHYHAAGFQGSLPINTVMVHYTFLDDILSLALYIILFFVFLLFFLGFCKALIGILCISDVGQWGLNVILDLPKPMKKYYETNLTNKKVRYDANGWPVHPDTKRRVRTIPRTTEICVNIIFFFVYPFYILMALIKKALCSKYYYSPSMSDKSICINSCYEYYKEKDGRTHKHAGTEVKSSGGAVIPKMFDSYRDDNDDEDDDDYDDDEKESAAVYYSDQGNHLVSSKQQIPCNELKAIEEVSEYSSTPNDTDHTLGSSSEAKNTKSSMEDTENESSQVSKKSK